MSVKEVVYEGGYYDILDGKLSNVIKRLQSLQEECPEEFRESLCIELDVYESYGSPSCDVQIYYYRPETEEEILERTNKEAFKLNMQRTKELQLLEVLKAKYEGSGND